MFVAPRAENLPCLDYLRCQAVAVQVIVETGARADKLWTDPQQLQITHLLDGIRTQHLQKLGQCRLRQTFYIIVAREHWPIPLAEIALELKFLGGVLSILGFMGRCRNTAIKNLVALSVLNIHELLSLLFGHMDAIRFGCFLLPYLGPMFILRIELLLFLDIAIGATGLNRSDFGGNL